MREALAPTNESKLLVFAECSQRRALLGDGRMREALAPTNESKYLYLPSVASAELCSVLAE